MPIQEQPRNIEIENVYSKSGNIKFLFIEHAPENIESVWNEIKNSDVILLEMILNKNLKSVLNNAFTASIISGANAQRQKLSTREFLVSNQENMPFNGPILLRSFDTNKHIQLIDIERDGPESILSQEADKLFTQSLNLFFNGKPEASLPLYKENEIKYAKLARLREFMVENEIEELLVKNSEIWKGKSITIIQGSAHTQTFHEFKRNNPSLKSDMKIPSSPYFYAATTWNMRKMAFFPNSNISDIECKRTLLAEVITHVLDDKKLSFTEMHKIGVRSLETDGKIDSIWNQIIQLSITNTDINGNINLVNYQNELIKLFNNIYLSALQPKTDNITVS